MNGCNVMPRYDIELSLQYACWGCLKQSDDVRLLVADERCYYQSFVNKVIESKVNMHMCQICMHLLRKMKKFIQQCQEVYDVINCSIGQDFKYSLISQMKPVIDLRKSDTQFVNYTNVYDNFDDQDELDDTVCIDEEDIPLVLLKSEDQCMEEDCEKIKKKRKRKKKEKNEEIKNNTQLTLKVENIFNEMEFYNSFEDDIKENDIKLERDLEVATVNKNKRKNPSKEGFSSRMVQETAEYTVIKLNKHEVLKEMESKSKTEEYLRSLYKCERCVRGFNFEDVLRTHMEKHIKKNRWIKCEICEQYCPSVISMRGHMKSHTTRYKCKVCGCVRLSRQVLLEHHSTSHTSETLTYSCQHCEFVSSKRTSMQRHVRTRHSKTEKHPCEQCGKVLNSLETLRVHTARHDKSKRVSCPDCDSSFVYPSLLQRHIRSVHERREFYCVECDVNFRSKENLMLHFKRNKKHRDVSTFKYECDHCSKRYMFLSALSRHIASAHTDEKHIVCCHCKKTFKRRSWLRAHIRTHFAKSNDTSDSKEITEEILDNNILRIQHKT